MQSPQDKISKGPVPPKPNPAVDCNPCSDFQPSETNPLSPKPPGTCPPPPHYHPHGVPCEHRPRDYFFGDYGNPPQCPPSHCIAKGETYPSHPKPANSEGDCCNPQAATVGYANYPCYPYNPDRLSSAPICDSGMQAAFCGPNCRGNCMPMKSPNDYANVYPCPHPPCPTPPVISNSNPIANCYPNATRNVTFDDKVVGCPPPDNCPSPGRDGPLTVHPCPDGDAPYYNMMTKDCNPPPGYPSQYTPCTPGQPKGIIPGCAPTQVPQIRCNQAGCQNCGPPYMGADMSHPQMGSTTPHPPLNPMTQCGEIPNVSYPPYNSCQISNVPVMGLKMSEMEKEPNVVPDRFRTTSGYDNKINNHPMYRTSNSEYGRWPPNAATFPWQYYGNDQSFSRLRGQGGMPRNRSLNTYGARK